MCEASLQVNAQNRTLIASIANFADFTTSSTIEDEIQFGSTRFTMRATAIIRVEGSSRRQPKRKWHKGRVMAQRDRSRCASESIAVMISQNRSSDRRQDLPY